MPGKVYDADWCLKYRESTVSWTPVISAVHRQKRWFRLQSAAGRIRRLTSQLGRILAGDLGNHFEYCLAINRSRPFRSNSTPPPLSLSPPLSLRLYDFHLRERTALRVAFIHCTHVKVRARRITFGIMPAFDASRGVTNRYYGDSFRFHMWSHQHHRSRDRRSED